MSECNSKDYFCIFVNLTNGLAMNDSQIVMGIMQNDERTWKHICRKIKPSFISIIYKLFSSGGKLGFEIEDLFQDTCMTLMQKVKEGKFDLTHEGALLSYMVQIGKNIAQNQIRKTFKSSKAEDDAPNINPLLPSVGKRIPDLNREQETEPDKISISDKQLAQNEFLDRVFDSIPTECKRIMKLFHWDHKPMDEIAGILGMKNADSAKTKKSRCMQKFKDIAKMLVESEEFAEETVRAAVERAALRELLETERIYAETGVKSAAFDVETDKEDE